MKIFVSGSRSIKKLNDVVLKQIDEYIDKEATFLIGDAIGVDELIQEYLFKKKYFNVKIYTVESKPRVLKSERFKLEFLDLYVGSEKGRKKQEMKDKKMTELADVLLVIWDGESRGSYENILRGLNIKKEVKVFFNGKFLTDVSVDKIKQIFYYNHKFSISEYIKEFKIKLTVKEVKKLLEHYGILKGDEILVKDGVIIERNKYGKTVFRFDKKILDKICKGKISNCNCKPLLII